ncbi:DinB family protein [Mycolicibacterium sp.]|uniref:DinB family protein n=1 Tax=Mycolicibacterium sp. TaxID=2320850 RepID=UPI0037C5634A
MQRCEECGYTYDLEAAPQAREAIRAGTAQLAGLLTTTEHDALARRPAPGVWAPLEYACHLRDMLLTQRERVLLARRVDTPQCVPMGRDERVGHEGYVEQDPVEVAAELTMAARLLGNAFARLDTTDWELRLVYNWPERHVRTLRWVAAHTLHEVQHHLLDVRRQLEAE